SEAAPGFGPADVSSDIDAWLARLTFATLRPMHDGPPSARTCHPCRWDETLRSFAARARLRIVISSPRVLDQLLRGNDD
ncbi:hypothetical protein, partial [Burkholderia pseudomallei]|uniref:hypothetical protein n=1 Tax=Burkholderia pseudomallei TaxID=28450 RepID=UPI00215612D2